MSDSDSDYIVEEYIKPAVVKHTYNNNDDYLSNSENSDNQEDISENVEESVDDKQDLSQCGNEAEIEDGETISNRTTSRNILHVSNLEFTTQKDDLYEVFKEAGDLKGIRIPKGRKGFAFVEMKTEEGLKVRIYKYFLFTYLIIILFF